MGQRWKTDTGFRLILVYSDEHNAARFRRHMAKVRKSAEARQWRKRMARRLRLAKTFAARQAGTPKAAP